MESNSYYGKFRGIVKDTNDLQHRGRICALVPDVFGDQVSGWAEPALPFAGPGMGFFAVPPAGTPVWIEFECGDPEYPIWTGCRWEAAQDVVALPPGAQQNADSVVALCTKGGHRIMLDDSSSGGITIQTSSGQKLIISDQGIVIDNGKGARIELSNNTVTINGGALEVT